MQVKQCSRTIVVPAKSESLHSVREVILKSLLEANVAQKVAQITMAGVDEALTSLIMYNEEKGFTHHVIVRLDVDDVRIRVCLTEPRNIFDMNNCSEEEFMKRANKERTHKIALFLMRQIFDEIQFTYRRGFENEMILVKFLFPEEINPGTNGQSSE